MHEQIPSVEQVRKALKQLSLTELEGLSEISGVPFTTIYKIRLKTTDNPGIETVRKFWQYIPEPAKAA